VEPASSTGFQESELPVDIVHDKTMQAPNFTICGLDFMIGQVHNTARMRDFV
jgi:hypothetical protein